MISSSARSWRVTSGTVSTKPISSSASGSGRCSRSACAWPATCTTALSILWPGWRSSWRVCCARQTLELERHPGQRMESAIVQVAGQAHALLEHRLLPEALEEVDFVDTVPDVTRHDPAQDEIIRGHVLLVEEEQPARQPLADEAERKHGTHREAGPQSRVERSAIPALEAIAVHVKYRGAGRARRPAQEVLAHELFRHERLQDAGRLLGEAEVTVLPRGQIQPWFVRVLPRDQRAAGPNKACRPLGQSAEQRLNLQRGHLRGLGEVDHVAAHALLIEADLAKEGRDHYQ